MKKISVKQKTIAFLLVAVTLMNTMGVPMEALVSDLTDQIQTYSSDSGSSGVPSADDLAHITIPNVTTNPNPYEGSAFILPVYTTGAYNAFNSWGLFKSYRSHGSRTGDRSEYYTGSVLILADRIESSKPDSSIVSDLPYTEERSLMFHPELTIRASTSNNNGSWMGGFLHAKDLNNITSNGESIWNYLDPDQTQMKVSGNLILGNGSMEVHVVQKNQTYSDGMRLDDEFYMTRNGSYGYSKRVLGENGEPNNYEFSATFPLTSNVDYVSVYYNGMQGSAITDPYAVILDDQAPYIKNVSFDMETGLRDDEADLIMSVEFNEGIRYTFDSPESDFANAYVEVSLWNSTAGKYQNVRLYLETASGGKIITFRGNIGRLHYCNFSINSINRVNVKSTSFGSSQLAGALDLADGFVLGSGRVINYDNSNQTINTNYSYNSKSPALLSDHAGNPVSLSGLTTWSRSALRQYSFCPNSFEADEIRIYNDKTLGVARNEIDADTATDSDMFVGPGADMTVHVLLSRTVEEDVWKQTYITLNILDENGERLKVFPTAATTYSNSEVYADETKTGTLLQFNDIRLSSEMSLDVEEGQEPLVYVTSIGTTYSPEQTGYPTAYPYVQAPENIMYADFTPPEISVRRTTDGELIADKTYYKITVETVIEEVDNYARVAGLVSSKAFISLSAGVETKTPILYYLSTDPTPSDDVSMYENKAELAPNTVITLGGFTMMNDRAAMYVHILAESGSLYLNNLQVGVTASDMAQNEASLDPFAEIEYIIDEVSPMTSVVSKKAIPEDNNTTMRLSVDVTASDHSRIDRMLYYFGGEEIDGNAEWQVAVIEEFGNTVKATVEKKYGDANAAESDANKVYSEVLWVKAVDTYGNESEPIGTYIRLSLQKPTTTVTYDGDPTQVSTAHQILVSGPDASLMDESPAYTRVTLTPLDSGEYAYVTLVSTGQKNVDVLALKDLEWYRVKLGYGRYEEVTGPVTVENDTEGILDPLTNYYGELKISFENGYGSEDEGKAMIPKVGELSAEAAAGSYFSDPNYYTVRYASPLLTDRVIHHVDFGAIIDYAIPFNAENIVIQTSGTTVVADADPGAEPYVFNQQYKGINPMRNAQIHFSISNVAQTAFGMLDFDYERSYAELVRVKEGNEENDTVVASRQGLWATDDQYFTVNNTMDNGEYFPSGAYYLRVTVVSRSGQTDVYESSKVILDAQTADTAGMWEYTYLTVADITKTYTSDDRYVEKVIQADDRPFSDIGIVVIPGGEISRDRYFATYAYGAEDLKIILSAPNSEKTYEGITVGEVEGFKVWNILSAPTEEEIEARRFELSPVSDSYGAALTNTLVRQSNTSAIYTSETIPKGIMGFSRLFLVKGTNTFCYQVKMKNGYVSPIRQFTVTVSDEAPTLSMTVAGYQPSLTPSQIDGIINADHVRYMVDTAYSINGSGNVKVDLWSRYDMNMGLFDEGVLTDRMVTIDRNGIYDLRILYEDMKVEEYADFTENSYTADFPNIAITYCTGVFVATDEYGGVTMVAPQIGDMDRLNVNTGTVGNAFEIDISYYGAYFDDPYTVDDGPFAYRILYNQPVYFGAQLLALETYMIKNTADEGEIRIKDIQTADPDLRYNLFNIDINDIDLKDGNVNGTEVYFENKDNIDYVLLSDATVTLSGGYLTEPVTLTFLEGNVIVNENGERIESDGNTVGYVYGMFKPEYISNEVKVYDNRLCFYLANPPADEDHAAGTETTLTYTFKYGNIYGDTYVKEGTVTLTYIEYKVEEAYMTESGAELDFSFYVKDPTNIGFERTGNFQNGTYTASIPDYYGNTKDYEYTVADDPETEKNEGQKDPNTVITYKKFTNTAQPVTVTLTGKYDIYVDVTDYEIMFVAGNGSKNVTVTVNKNTRFSYRYLMEETDGVINEVTNYIDVNNIFELNPKVVYNIDLKNINNYNVAEDGTRYRYGSLTVYLTDPNFILRDKYTGEIPTFTFVPGGEPYYVFKADEIEAILGDETVTLKDDVTVVLNVKLYEVPEIDFTVDEDTETPNVQVKAYSKRGNAYSDQKLSMQLMSTRNSNALTNYYGYETFSYVGNRANMSEILDRIGWSTAYRFTVETVDSSRVRLFVKEGLYADAPDFNTGVSDNIDGVILNSKLLTVTKNIKFTLFVVDSFNNSSSVAFNVTNISEAPVPSLVKIPMSHNLVRVYVIPPVDDSNNDLELTILTPGSGTETDQGSPYYLKKYVDITANDDYPILYTIAYQGQTVTGSVDVSVSEISVDEITMKSLTWSANKTAEATPSAVTVDILFSHNVSEISANRAYSTDKVSFTVAGNTVRVTYSDNHAPISFTAFADNDTFVAVNLDAVTNIDKTAPVVTKISEELAANGRFLDLVLATDERTTFREGYGRMGEAQTDENGVTLYYYTIRITENGEHRFTFSNMSGIQSVYVYTADSLVLDEIEVLYNTAPQDDGALSSPDGLALKTGDTVYIKPSRNVTATLSETDEELTIPGGEWYSLTIPGSAGGIPPYIIYTDEYENVLTHQFAKVEIPDSTPPEIIVKKLTYPVRVDTDRAQVEAELISNFVAFDDKDATVMLAVEFTADLSVVGLTDVIYTATDSAGNIATAYGKLRITSIYEPVVYINDKRIIRDEGMNIKSGEDVILNINTSGVDYKAIIANGKRTAAQMKGLDAFYEGKADTLNLEDLDDGFYTILIVTEQRDYFRIFISIEKF